MINLVNRSFNVFYHQKGGVVFDEQKNKINLSIHDSITNQVELVAVTASELAAIITTPQPADNVFVKIWDAGILNGGFPSELHRSLMFDAHSFVLDPFPSSETFVDFSFKMLFGFVKNAFQNKSKDLREEYADEYVQVDARLQRFYSPHIAYSGILSQPFVHNYFGGAAYALDFLSYSLLNHNSPVELNNYFKPVTLPAITSLPLIKRSFSLDKTQTLDTLLIPYNKLIVD